MREGKLTRKIIVKIIVLKFSKWLNIFQVISVISSFISLYNVFCSKVVKPTFAIVVKNLLSNISFQNGGKIVFATDDWFACAENLLKVSFVLNII